MAAGIGPAQLAERAAGGEHGDQRLEQRRVLLEPVGEAGSVIDEVLERHAREPRGEADRSTAAATSVGQGDRHPTSVAGLGVGERGRGRGPGVAARTL